jgi:hypothetical protein
MRKYNYGVEQDINEMSDDQKVVNFEMENQVH